VVQSKCRPVRLTLALYKSSARGLAASCVAAIQTFRRTLRSPSALILNCSVDRNVVTAWNNEAKLRKPLGPTKEMKRLSVNISCTVRTKKVPLRLKPCQAFCRNLLIENCLNTNSVFVLKSYRLLSCFSFVRFFSVSLSCCISLFLK